MTLYLLSSLYANPTQMTIPTGIEDIEIEDLSFLLKEKEAEAGNLLWGLSITLEPGDNYFDVYCVKRNSAEIHKELDRILANYYVKRSCKTSFFDQVFLIAYTIGKIDRLHPLEDGNSRTNWVVANKWRKDLKLPFSLIQSPLSFFHQNTLDLTHEFVLGMERFVQQVSVKFSGADVKIESDLI